MAKAATHLLIDSLDTVTVLGDGRVRITGEGCSVTLELATARTAQRIVEAVSDVRNQPGPARDARGRRAAGGDPVSDTCAHLSEKDNACGKPAVAVWWSPVQGKWHLCERHDAIAQRYTGPEYQPWSRQVLAPEPDHEAVLA